MQAKQMEYMGYNIDNNLEAIGIIKAGIGIEAFEGLRKDLGITDKLLAEIAGIPARTFFKRKAEGRLKPQESERLTRIARVFYRAIDVFENKGVARQWMNTHLKPIGSTPLRMCDTEPGSNEVERILGRIEHGIYS